MAKQKQVSKQSEEEAYKIAMGIQKPNQSKEQTKLIAQGISKGIDLYKKQQKAKAREQDRNRKKTLRQRDQENAPQQAEPVHSNAGMARQLPWWLLVISWLGFALYLFMTRR